MQLLAYGCRRPLITRRAAACWPPTAAGDSSKLRDHSITYPNDYPFTPSVLYGVPSDPHAAQTVDEALGLWQQEHKYDAALGTHRTSSRAAAAAGAAVDGR